MLNEDWTEYISDFNLAKSNPKIKVLKFIDDMNRRERIKTDRLVKDEIERRRRERKQSNNQIISKNNSISIHRSSCFGYPRY